MKIVTLVSRILLGLAFTVFGLNGFLHFIPQPPMPPSPALTYMGVMMQTHYFVLVFLLQLVCGLLFLANRFIPLALTLIAPVIVNILMFHVLMNPGGLPPGILVTVLWFVVFYSVRGAFAGILSPTPAV